MLYREIIAVCSEIHTKRINTLCGQNVEFFWVCVLPCVIYSYHWAERVNYLENSNKNNRTRFEILMSALKVHIWRCRRLMHYLQWLQSPFIHYLQCLHILRNLRCQSQKTGKLRFFFLLHNACLQYSAPQWDELWKLYCWTPCVFYSPISTQNYAHDFRRNAQSPSSDVPIILVRFLNQTWWMLRTSHLKKRAVQLSVSC